MHAKNSSVAFPKASEVFRLKKNYKNLSNDTYAKNLIAYLNKITCVVNMDMDDFKTALQMLSD